MIKNQQTFRKLGRNLTKRQIERRKSKYNDKFIGELTPPSINTDSMTDLKQLYTFGLDSRVYKNADRFIFDVFGKDLEKFDALQLSNVISYVKSPVVNFMSSGNGLPSYPVRPAKMNMLHIGIWMSNVQHYSGGRIHILLAAHLIAQMGHKVTIITDSIPPMMNDFKYFEVEDRLEFVHGESCQKSNWLLDNADNNIDIVIATPRIMEAFAYARKHSLPCYGMLLETPNFVSKYRGGLDGTEAYWSEYKIALKMYTIGILSNPGPTIEAAKEWLEDSNYNGDFFEFPPAINTPACDKVFSEEKNEITFIGRHLDFKCPDDVIKAVGKIKKDRPEVNFIGSHNSTVRNRMQMVADQKGVTIRFYAKINDFEKFYIIKRSKMLVIPSKFEGFGMPPAEALYCNKPVVVYDLEITKWIYGKTLNYVKPGDLNAMAKKIAELCKNEDERNEQGNFGYKQMWSEESNIPCLPHKIQDICRNVFYGKDYPRITAGIIVLNGVDTLKPTLDSIYSSVDKIIVVEGAVEDYAVNNSKLISDGHSKDGTLEFLMEYPDHLNKIQVITIEDVFPKRKTKCWKNKNEMQNSIADNIDTELYLKVDADEVWKQSDIEYIRRTFMKKPELDVIYMQRWHFWKNLQTVAVGGQWDSAEARAWRWRKDFRHNIDIKGGFNYFFDSNGNKVAEPSYKTMKLMLRMHYHLGYCRDDKHIKGKINYYANRGIEKNVKDNYTSWQQGQPTNSTHPSGTTATPFVGRLPIVLDKVNYPDVVNVNPKVVIENNITMLKSPNK